MSAIVSIQRPKDTGRIETYLRAECDDDADSIRSAVERLLADPDDHEIGAPEGMTFNQAIGLGARRRDAEQIRRERDAEDEA